MQSARGHFSIAAAVASVSSSLAQKVLHCFTHTAVDVQWLPFLLLLVSKHGNCCNFCAQNSSTVYLGHSLGQAGPAEAIVRLQREPLLV